MHKWIAVVGSSRKGMNTDSLVDATARALARFDIEVEKVYLSDKDIQTCNACEYCISKGDCHIDDPIGGILQKMKTYDGVILSTPSYNYNMTAQVKALVDRTFSLNDYTGGWSSRVPAGKKAITLGTCMGINDTYMGFAVKGMSLCLTDLEYDVIAEVCYYDTKSRSVKDDPEIEDQIYDLIKDKL